MSASDIKQSIIDKLDHHSGGVDYIMILKLIGNFKPILEYIVGWMVVLTLTMLLVIIALELAYLCSPTVKHSINDKFINTDGVSRSRMELILSDAIASYKEYETIGRESNLLLIYLKRKLKVVFIYGICLSFVLGYGGELARIIMDIYDNSISKIISYFG
jgi:hypothetical protein